MNTITGEKINVDIIPTFIKTEQNSFDSNDYLQILDKERSNRLNE